MLQECRLHEDFFCIFRQKKETKSGFSTSWKERALFNNLNGIFAWHCLFNFNAFNSTHLPEGDVEGLSVPLKWN